MASPLILNEFGRPVQAGALYRSPRNMPGATDATRSRARLDGDAWRMLSREDHLDMIDDSRAIARRPVVRGAIEQKAQYACAAGFLPAYAGREEAFGEAAEEALEQAFKIINVRGELWDFDAMHRIGSQALDVDGDFFTLLSETETGWPLLQSIEAHRVHNRMGQTKVWQAGAFMGLPIINGIVYGPALEELAYQVLGNTKDDDAIVPATDMIRCASPIRSSEGRPLAPVSYALHDWYSYHDCHDNELRAQKSYSSLVFVENNESGLDESGKDFLRGGPAAPDGSPNISELDGGLHRYVKAGSGKIEAFLATRPSAEVKEFWREVSAGALYGMGWRREMMDLSSLNGAGVRGFQDNINTVILDRWRVLSAHAMRCVRYIIAKLIKRGDLPADADWWRWEMPRPPEFTVDAGRSVTADIDAVRSGFDWEGNIIAARLGITPRKFYRLRAANNELKKQVAREFGQDPSELGYLTRPGDVAPAPAAPDPNTLP